MSRLTRFLDEFMTHVPRRLTGRAMWRGVLQRQQGTIRNVGRELEELEPRVVPTLLGQQLFPLNYPINENIANAPVAANSAAIINHIGTSVQVHPDVGYDNPAYGDATLYGIPFNVVHGNSVTKVKVIIDGYPSQSDQVPVPIPANAVISGDYQNGGQNDNGPGYGNGQRGDSDLLIWDEDNNIAYELFGASRPQDVTNSTGQWEATQETVWNMNTDEFRTLGETSADAAGLSMLAGLLRPDEALPVSQGGQGAIDHALRFTLPISDIDPQYIYPASHEAGGTQASDNLPFGSRLRLENTPAIDTLISKMGPEAQVVATELQQYGLILADVGAPMFITGSSASVNANNQISLTWGDTWSYSPLDDIFSLESLTVNDFQVVNLTPIVTSLSESSGSAGNTVTITGNNFAGAAGNLFVNFGSAAATSVTYVSDTEITAVVPNGTGTVNVTVQSGIDETDNLSGNPNANATAPIFGYGISATSASDEFTYSTQTISASNSTVSFASSTDASGTTDLVTIVVEDTNGNPVSGLSNSAFSFSLSVGTSTGSFGTVSQTSTPGTYTAEFTGSTAGSDDTLTLTIDGVQLNEEPTIQVTAGAVSGSTSSVKFASSTDASGSADTVTVVVEDAAGNAIAGLANSAFAFSLSGGTSTGTFGTVSQTSTLGTYTDTFTGVVAGTVTTLILKVNVVQLTTQPKVTVNPGAVSGSNSTVSFASSTDTSGAADTATIVVEDAAGNPIAGLANSAFAFSLAGGTSTGTFGAVTQTATPGTYTAAFTGAIAGTASTLTLKVNGVQLSSQPTIQVQAGGVSGGKSTVSFASSSVASGVADTATIVVEDAAGNPITGLANSAFAFSLAGGTSTGTFGTVTPTSTPGTYTATFTGVLAGTASTLTLKVSGVQLATQPKATVTPGAVSGAQSTVSFANSSVASGGTDTVTIVVEDAAGNAISGLSNSAFSFDLSGGTSTGTFGTVSPSSTPGTYTASFTGVAVGTASTLVLAVSGVQLNTEPQVTVTTAVSGTNSTVSFAASTDASGTSDAVTIVVENAAGNPITGLANSAFAFSLSGGTSTGAFGTVTPTSTPGTYTAAFAGVIAGTASTLTLDVSGVQLSSQPTVQVTPGAVNGGKSTVSFASSTDASGATDTVTIVVEDAAGNAITGLANSAFAFSLSGGTSTGTIGTVTPTATAGTYIAAFMGAVAGTASTLTLNVSGVQLSSQPTVQVTPGAVSTANSTVSFASSTDASAAADTVTIVVEDAAGNAITGLANSAFAFSLSGGSSTGTFGAVTQTSTPGAYTATFTGAIAGTASTLTLGVSGVQLNSEPQVTVTPGAISSINSTSNFTSATDTSGQGDTVTVVVEDAAGNAIPGLSSSAFSFSLSGGTSTGTFGTVTQTSTPGTYTAMFTGAIAGTASGLSTTIDGVKLNDPPAVEVMPGSVNGGNSTVSFANSSVASGSTDTVTIVVEDAAGNAISGLSNSAFSFSLSGGTSTGTFGTVAATSTPGIYTAAFTAVTAGTASTLTLSVSGVQLTSEPQVTVTPAAISSTNSTVTFASSTVASGTIDTVTIIVENSSGDAVTGLVSSDFTFNLSGGTSTGTFGPVAATATPGAYTAAFTGAIAGTASTLTLQVSGVQLSTQPQVTVKAGAVSASNSTVSLATATVQSGSTDAVTILVKDAAGNAIGGLTSASFNFSLSGGASTGRFSAVSATSTPGAYTATFTGAIAGTASTVTLKVNGVALTTHPTVQVTPGVVSASASSVTVATTTVASGTTDRVIIAVKDAAKNPIGGLSSSDFTLTLTGKSTATFGSVTPTTTPGTYTVLLTGVVAGAASIMTVNVNGVTLTMHPGITVQPGAVSSMESSVSFASSTVATGSTDKVTITVKDAAGNAISGLTNGAFVFALSGGTSTGRFGKVTATATPGVYTVVFTGGMPGTASDLKLDVDGVLLATQPTIRVT